ncbi:MAG: diguanylate cyclase [Proteobacteria bacterium]|nr:diguanylate cyclase [Pseudomonadota bacterium]
MEILLLLVEAILVYGLVLGAHALRHRVGLTYFYAIIGSITAIMSWVTDAGIRVEMGGITFLVGSTVFYTSLLLGVFVVYVFDGPRATRIAIFTVLGISMLMPVIALILNLQASLVHGGKLGYLPMPSLRINSASVFATFMDLIFLAVAWEFLQNRLPGLHYWVRAFATLLGVMWLDVVLFNTGAFAGQPDFLNILKGTLYSRMIISVFAAPILVLYLSWEGRREGIPSEHRPLLAILQQFSEVKQELNIAQQEIERRKKAEAALMESEEKMRRLAATDGLTGLANRRHFREQAIKEIAECVRYQRTLSLLMVDLDRFKAVNDTYGHESGDKVLVSFARSAEETAREIDVVGRLGGEEFALLLPNTDTEGAAILAERLRRAMEENRVRTHTDEITVTISIGLARWSEGESLDDLLKRADQALYRAKNTGRNRVEIAGSPA